MRKVKKENLYYKLLQIIMDIKATDIEFLQNIFKGLVPAVISDTGSEGLVFIGWLNVTKEQSEKLEKHADYDGLFMFFIGKTTKYITADIDRKDDSRKRPYEHVDRNAPCPWSIAE